MSDAGVRPVRDPRWITRGQPTALAAVARMAVGPVPHAVLLAGPAGVGKATLALDLAAALLCVAPDPTDRPCRTCRACRLVAAGNHPDLHRLAPEGAGGQVVIGDPRDAKAVRGVRDVLHELAFLPVEGGARVAIVEHAEAMNEDAQNALLKTLEEPPPGVTVVLCADRDELLLPTVRSRCVRIRLGPTGPREIEGLLADLGLVDAATAGRLARLAEGRSGVALSYARAPEAIAIRDEIGRTLLDLLRSGRSARLAAVRDLLARSRDLAEALDGVPPSPGRPPAGRSGPTRAGVDVAVGPEDESEDDAGPTRAAPAERRRAARQLVAIWRDVARDLALLGLAGPRAIHDPALLEELESSARGLPDGAVAEFLVRLDAIAEGVAGNVSPELAIDVAILAWPRVQPAAA